ncbi:MAG: HAMP domain-containing histidine kinase [Clostridia bacterium]|nr:HAMP domain-containing histidine kinase [Clostridia bacterium]
MATKLKNTKTGIIIKAVCVILSLACVFCSACAVVRCVHMLHVSGKNIVSEIGTTQYTDTGLFGKNFTQAVTDARGIAQVLGNGSLKEKLAAEKDKNVQTILDGYLERQEFIITEELRNAVREYESEDDYAGYSEENIKTAKKALTSASGKEILKYKNLLRNEAFDQNYDIFIPGLSYNDNVGYSNYTLDYLGYDENVAKEKISAYYDKAVAETANESYTWLLSELKQFREFDYYIAVKGNKTVVTNIKSPAIKEITQNAAAYFDGHPEYSKYVAVSEKGIESKGVEELKTGNYFYSFGDLLDRVTGKDFWPENATVYVYYNNSPSALKTDWETNRTPFVQTVAYAAALLIVSLVCLIAAAVFSGHKNEEGKIVLHPNDKIPADISLILAVFFFVAFMGGAIGFAGVYLLGGTLAGLHEAYDMTGLQCTKTTLAAAGAFSALALGTAECWLFSTVRIKKSGRKWFRSFIIFRPFLWICRKIKGLFTLLAYKPKHLGRNVVVFIIGTLAVDLLLMCATVNFAKNAPGAAAFCALVLIAFNVFFIRKTVDYFRKLDTIIEAAQNGDYNIDTAGYPSSLKSLCDSMQVTGEKLSKAVDAAVKDERMRAELITNVSHDLKTPLTSIINYTDLLSRCSIDDETAKGYIEVLSERSGRLKVLIEDLVEASKASSGAISLNIEPLDLSELAKQTAGEMQENFDRAQLEIKQVFPESPVIIKADGLRTCRILENLMGNAAKYSAANSRVYITVSSDGENGVFEIKNISRNELNISADELTERFVRGDSSRTDGGNGLGLSIARDLAVLQGGSLGIEIDGDLFKATVKLPLGK